MKKQSSVNEQLKADAAAAKTLLTQELSCCQQEVEVTRVQLESARQEVTNLEAQLVECRTQLDAAREDRDVERKNQIELTKEVWLSSVQFIFVGTLVPEKGDWKREKGQRETT